MKGRPPIRFVFVTGTDTGVGKTLLTSLLLSHLRQNGRAAFALKPFCSGDRADAELLHKLQDGDLTLDQINPFFFPEPLAPLVSARKHHRKISLEDALDRIRAISSDVVGSSIHRPSNPTAGSALLIEGAGGLLVPLGANFTLLDLILRLPPTLAPSPAPTQVIVVARNKLGTLNHCLLTLLALHPCFGDLPSAIFHPRSSSPSRGGHCPSAITLDRPSPLHPAPRSTPHLSLSVVLMNSGAPDLSSSSNPLMLRELIAPVPLLSLPFLGLRPSSVRAIQRNAARLQRSLRQLLHQV